MIVLTLLFLISITFSARDSVSRGRCRLCLTSASPNIETFSYFADPNRPVPTKSFAKQFLANSSRTAVCHLNAACPAVPLAMFSDEDSALQFLHGLAVGFGLVPPSHGIASCIGDIKTLIHDVALFGHALQNTYDDYKDHESKWDVGKDCIHDFREFADSVSAAAKAVQGCGLTDLVEFLAKQASGAFSGFTEIEDAIMFIIHFDNIIDDIDDIVNGNAYQVGYGVGNLLKDI